MSKVHFSGIYVYLLKNNLKNKQSFLSETKRDSMPKGKASFAEEKGLHKELLIDCEIKIARERKRGGGATVSSWSTRRNI